MTEQLMYFIVVLSKFANIIEGVSSLIGTVLFIAFIGYIVFRCGEAYYKKVEGRWEKEAYLFHTSMIAVFKPLVFISGILFAILLLLYIFIPRTEEMATIYILPKILNNENLQNMPNNLIDLAYEWIEKLRPENIIKE